jgi:membrane-bound ClpP family serine protease
MKTTFGKQNYQLFIGGIVLIILGYLLMIGGGSEDPNVFNPAIFDAQRITIAPMVCLLGFVVIIVAIMWRPKSKEDSAEKSI